VGRISPWDFLCATVQSRHLAKSDKTLSLSKKRDPKEKLSLLIEETTQILTCLKTLLESCCSFVFDNDKPTKDKSSISLTAELSRALYNTKSVELFLQSDFILDRKGLIERIVVDRNNKSLSERIVVDRNNQSLSERIVADRNNKSLGERIFVDKNSKSLSERIVVDRSSLRRSKIIIAQVNS
jgi:hypothetical protein